MTATRLAFSTVPARYMVSCLDWMTRYSALLRDKSIKWV